MDFGHVLLATLSSDQHIRQQATQALEQAAGENFSVYLSLLCQELANENGQVNVRIAAGVAIKNALVSKDLQRRVEQGNRWMAIDPVIRMQIKNKALETLNSAETRAGTAAAQLVAAIAFVELAQDAWPDLMGRLIANMTNTGVTDGLRRCTLETIGFICEEIDPEVLEGHSNQILTAVVNGLRTDESSVMVRAAAANALLNSLEFVRANFEHDDERNFIMRVVCEATQASDEAIVVPAFECLVKILQLYYPKMALYMEHGVAQLTINSIRAANENVALQAIEFWSTICDIERDLEEGSGGGEAAGLGVTSTGNGGDFYSLKFARKAAVHLLPVLLERLTQQIEEDADEWSPAMAAATCLALLAECIRDEIFCDGIVMSFVQQNINHGDWRHREAAVMAFGSVMDGPGPSIVAPYIEQGLAVLLGKMSDPSLAVCDTSAWAIGRVIDYFHELLPSNQLPLIIQTLTDGLARPARVAINCCWSLMSLFVHYGDEGNGEQTSPISQHLPAVASALFACAQRQQQEEGDEHNLRSAAYQSLANVVLFAPMDTIDCIVKIQQAILLKLSESQTLVDQIVGVDDRMRYSELQAHLCIVLQNTIKKLGKPGSPQLVQQVMSIILAILQSARSGKGSATELEDLFLLLGTLIAELDREFAPYAASIMPYVCAAIQNHQDYHLCMVAVGVVGDIARALGETLLLPYGDQLMTLLLQALQDGQLSREVKPQVISTIGDLALALGPAFQAYLHPCMQILAQASLLQPTNEDDYDEIDFICQLRESLLEAYTGIVQGTKDNQQAAALLAAYVEQITSFIAIVAADPNRSDTTVRAAIGLLGDLADAYRPQMRLVLRNDHLLHFMQQPLENDELLSDSTQSVVKWAQNIVRQVV